MKQPQLGKKIVELREQKGLTQEDVSEMCTINVRTIQRIEAGETTPRTYTIKILLNALGSDYEKVFEKQHQEGTFDRILRFFPARRKQVLKVSLIAGIVYFVFSFIELAFLTNKFFDLSTEANWSDLDLDKFYDYKNQSGDWIYILIKTISILTFSFFMRGFVLIGSYYKNNFVEFMAFLMIVVNIILEPLKLIFINSEVTLGYLLILQSLTFGFIMIFFGIGLFRLKTHLGDLLLITGVLEIITGVCFATIFLSALGLFSLFPLELLELLVLYKAVSKVE